MGEVGQKLQTLKVPILKHSTPSATSGPALHLCSVIASASFGPSEYNFSHLANGDNYMVLIRSNELLYVKVVKAPTASDCHGSSLVLLTSSLPLFPCQQPSG